MQNRRSFFFHLHPTVSSPFHVCVLSWWTVRKCSVLQHVYSDHPRSCVAMEGGCWNSSIPGTSSAQQIHRDNQTSCSEAFTDYLHRWSLSHPRKECALTWHTGLGGLMCRALFSQTSKFRPSHCQRQHTELNEAVGWTNMANLIALTTNMAHITLNCSTRRDWTHITKGVVQGMLGIFSAT